MRVVAEIPHPDFKITVFSWNGKYLLKLERGMFEQTYKISEMDVSGDEEIKNMLTEDFIKAVGDIFLQMRRALGDAMDMV